jgi:phosphopentomutase
MRIKRVALIVIDGLGIGNAPDAAAYGDEGANTLKHVMEKGNPQIPNLTDMGLLNAAKLKGAIEDPLGCFGAMAEKAAGKDTTSGHWELAGLTLKEPFPTFPSGFPADLIERFEYEIGMSILGNKVASGTQIIEELGSEHLRTGSPIVYTSADSVFQVAAHEAIIPPTELWHICRIARRILTGPCAVGRVIARPFLGSPGAFVRTENRRDFSIDPPDKTMLDLIKDAGRDVIGIGKIEDIFNHRGLTSSNHASGNPACIEAITETLKKNTWKGLMFANLVDTDSLYGHRNDIPGYARALEQFDEALPEIMRLMGEDAMLMIAADHGTDPGFPGTDHTRECVPILCWSLSAQEGVNLGQRASFADVSATILDVLGIKNTLGGVSFWPEIKA